MSIKRFLLIPLAIALISACSKDETTSSNYTINYKLKGWYLRDTSIKSDGYIGINFSEEGNYCWKRQIAGKDSSRCEGTFIQNSDTSFLWNGYSVVYYKIDTIDTQNRKLRIRMTTTPASNPLTGSY
ncbi:MAG: hypothetical protein LCH37_13590 [Bacteroidetes bacterium]|nr:hypothetical protein [Bacteroidota bacterium]MCK6611154.1 hypothetical protein [Bacteroidia bacterium]